MLRYFCTWFRRNALLITATAACALAALPLQSQNGPGNHTNSAQAVMHIRVNVVPVVMAPATRQNVRAESAITYNLPARPAHVTVSEDLRLLNAEDGFPALIGKSFVRVTTVVAE